MDKTFKKVNEMVKSKKITVIKEKPTVIEIPKVEEKRLKISCPNCHSVDEFILVNNQRNEYKCSYCLKGFSGYPPPIKNI